MRKLADSDGAEVTAGCTVHFAYGIPPVGVVASVIERNGVLIALTPGHNPSEVKVSSLKRHVGDFWVVPCEHVPIEPEHVIRND